MWLYLALQRVCVNVACLQSDPHPQLNIHDVTCRILFMEGSLAASQRHNDINVALNVTWLFGSCAHSRESDTFLIHDHMWKRPESDLKMSASRGPLLFTLSEAKQVQVACERSRNVGL